MFSINLKNDLNAACSKTWYLDTMPFCLPLKFYRNGSRYILVFELILKHG